MFISNHKLCSCVVDSEVKLLNVMKEAGVLENLNDVIARTKEGHLDRMKILEHSIAGNASCYVTCDKRLRVFYQGF